MSKRYRILVGAAAALILFTAVFPVVLRSFVRLRYQSLIYDLEDAPERPVAVVFGAAVYRGGRLSTVLRDRMDTAIEMYQRGLVSQIIVSGHQEAEGYDEPGAMKSYAVARGVPTEALLVDSQGNRTYETCYRLQYVFGRDSAALVTQDFHLPRALYTCSNLGIEAIGVRADRRPYRGASWYELRETAATFVAMADLLRQHRPQDSVAATQHIWTE